MKWTECPGFIRLQTNASHLFARTASFIDRPKYKRPASIHVVFRLNKSCSVRYLAENHNLLEWQRYVTVNVLLFSVPIRLTNVSLDQTALEGSNMILFCEATGRPTPNITWTRVLKDYSNSKILHQGSAWVFLNISRTASGTYRCTADNGFGNLVSQILRVNVTCKCFTYSLAFFTINSAHLHYNEIQHVCETISGYFVVLARNCLASTLDCIVM